MKFGKLEINPAKNPGILDTGTWDPDAAWAIIDALDERYWMSIRHAAETNSPLPPAPGFVPTTRTVSRHPAGFCFLAELVDGQHVFVEWGDNRWLLGKPVRVKALQDGSWAAMFKTDAAVVNHFVQRVMPRPGLRPLGPVPGLGIGTRMTTAVWPGIFQAMAAQGFGANVIQNSVRELNPLEDLLAARPSERNYAFNFGLIESGYTGSTYEGIWVSGVLAALKHAERLDYGADADHIQMKRGPGGLAHALRLLDATRYYTFFTLDMSDILDYRALDASGAGDAYLVDRIQASDQRRAVLDYHAKGRRIGGHDYRPDADILGRLVGKYWEALDAMEDLTAHIASLRDGLEFDLELSIDEHPPEIGTFDCLTTQVELAFVLLEAQRRGLPLTHVAPNFGVEKGVDYGGSDGLEGLEARIRDLVPITQDCGVMIDFHSGDDLGSSTRQAIRRAAQGYLHFKISPSLQLLFAEVLQDFDAPLFRRWYDDALAYARREAENGSSFAVMCLQSAQESDAAMSPYDEVFHHYSFAYVGRRSAEGQFLNRELFYDLSPSFYREYQARLYAHLCHLAEELL